MVPLLAENVCKRFRQGDQPVIALENVNLKVEQGEFVAIMGASGSGKSTLLHLMAGLAKPDSGKVFIDSTNLNSLSDRQLTLFRRQHVGLVFQAFNLIPTLTAEENIALPLLLDGQPSRQIQAKVEELLVALGLGRRRKHRPDALSGGEQQRIAIARSLITNPSVLFADEPTGSLDSANSQSVCELLRDLCAIQKKTILMVTHEPGVAAFAQRIIRLKDGKVVKQ